MSFFKRLGAGVLMGFLAAPAAGAASVVMCKSLDGAGVTSADGLTNHAFDKVDLPTREELEYVKTWGLRWVEDWDRPGLRGAALPERASSNHRRQIILIRHGQYENERSHDDRIRKLTGLGHRQAEQTGRYLAQLFQAAEDLEALKAERREAEKELKGAMKHTPTEEPENPKVAELRELVQRRKHAERSHGSFLIASQPRYVHVSDMTRAKETAQHIIAALPSDVQKRLVVDEQLRERYPCDPQPPLSGREASAADMKAAEDVFERYFHRPAAGEENTVEVIVGHANVIRYLTMRALQLPPEAWLRVSLPHCSITSIVINGHGHVKLSSLGSFGHLPADMVTVHNIG